MDSFRNKIFLYKTTNNINKMIYIGVHKCRNHNCNYLGSGYYLNRAIEKYGKENFSVEIIQFFDNLDDAYKMEKSIVHEYFVESEFTYNLVVGGLWGKINKETRKEIGKKVSKALKGRKLSQERKSQISDYMKGHIVSEETKRKISISHLGKIRSETHRKNISLASKVRTKKRVSQVKRMIESNKGSKRTEEQKQKMRDAWALRKITNDNN